ncbi:MAG: glutathione S-transferase [Betaproteobacteria bacterium]|nr:glutathione S-transferase [Betaproteobacteria bacterium]
MKLYDMELSGNCYKVRLLLSLLRVPYESIRVGYEKGEHKQPEFLKLNPRGQLPVLDDGGFIVWDSMAILVYLAREYGDDAWLPTAPGAMAEVMQWLAVSENEILYGLARARAVKKFNRPWDLPQCQRMGEGALSVLDGQLETREWLAADRPTIADIACYPYVALAPEGGIGLGDYASVNKWIGRIKALPGYVGMPGL